MKRPWLKLLSRNAREGKFKGRNFGKAVRGNFFIKMIKTHQVEGVSTESAWKECFLRHEAAEIRGANYADL